MSQKLKDSFIFLVLVVIVYPVVAVLQALKGKPTVAISKSRIIPGHALIKAIRRGEDKNV